MVGVTGGVRGVITEGSGDLEIRPIFVLIGAAILGALVTEFGWWITGAILTWTGGWLGGGAKSDSVRAAMAWSAVPYIASIFVWLALLPLYGQYLLRNPSQVTVQNPLPSLIALFIGTVLTLWWYFLFWKCYAEVQGLSLIRALIAILLPGFIAFGILFGCLVLTSF